MNNIAQIIKQVLFDVFAVDHDIHLSRPDEQFGDYATNIALQVAKPLGKNPHDVAESTGRYITGDKCLYGRQHCGAWFY